MIAIVNVDPNPRSSGPHLYEIRLNRRGLAMFVHNREDDLATLFEKAAVAARYVPGRSERALIELARISQDLDF